LILTPPTKGAGTLRRAERSQAFTRIPGGRHMECAYYFVDGTWNLPTTFTFVGRDGPAEQTEKRECYGIRWTKNAIFESLLTN
jgi:hypothetical protein